VIGILPGARREYLRKKSGVLGGFVHPKHHPTFSFLRRIPERGGLMNRKILHELEYLYLLDLEPALRVIVEECLFKFIQECKASVSPSAVTEWVSGLDKEVRRVYEEKYKHSKEPLAFLIWMFEGYRWRVIKEGMYHRKSARKSRLPPMSKAQISNLINTNIARVNFGEKVVYLGELAGAYVLTCPETTIRADPQFESIQNDYKKIIAPGRPSSFDIALRLDNGSTIERTENEIMLIYYLDYFFHSLLEWWMMP
jgi:hypothetical protein